MRVLNFKMLSHPVNYITVLVMLVIAGMAGHQLLELVGVVPGDTPAN